jgi:hypothetical protein
MNSPTPLRLQFDHIQQRALVVGVVGLALCLLGSLLNSEQFFRSYLLAYLFWISIALGCFALVMLHHLVGGAWGFIIQRLLESGTRTLPLMAVLFVPFLFGLHDLYIWARPEEIAHDEILQHKSLYLNIPFFLLRTALYFAAWLGVAYWLNKWSREQDRTAEPSLTRRLQLVSGPGLVLYVLTVTFASIDWVMSLEPHWFSTIYGILFVVGQALTTLAFAITVVALLADHEPLSQVLTPAHFHDLGNLLLAFVMLWAYMAFSQYLIIWSGNLAEEIPWYLHRRAGGWQWLGLFLILFHFVVPFLLLLSRGTKRRLRMLSTVAAAIILMRLVDLFWLVAPAFHQAGLRIHWMDVVAPIGVGGLWLAVFVWQLKGRPLLPLHDPRLPEVLDHG